jgi:CubicO group peptidase (beta-lactamase class C family)
MYRMLVLCVVACAGSEPAVRPPVSAPASAPNAAPVAASAAAPAAALLAAPAPAAPTAPPQLFTDDDPGYAFADPARAAKLAAAFPKIDVAIGDAMKRDNLPGLALGIVIDGELAYAKGYGVADVDTRAVPDADTAYRIGSISKSFAALGLLALRDDGVLGLDDPAVRWLPEAAALRYPTRDARPITLRQLLTHTSGLVRDVDFTKTDSDAAFLAQLQGMALENPPGQQFVYSNLGFAMLGIAFARASHATLPDAMARRVFGPLGMTATGYDTAPGLAPAYQPDNKTRRAKLEHLGVAGGAGGIVSTVRDMARYAAFELSAYPPRGGDDHGPIRRATLREAHATGFAVTASLRPQPEARRGEPALELDAYAYGFGWQHHRTCDFDDLVEHGGAIDSYRASVQLLTQHGVGVVVLTNFGNANTYRIGQRVIQALRATGALQPYVAHPRLAPGYEATMKAFLAVYNQWNEDALKAVLARPLGPAEHDEMIGYHKLHGDCSAFAPKDIVSPRAATFAMTCERGVLEMQTSIAPDGRLTGFNGISRRVAVPAEVPRAAKAWMSLIARWDDAVFARTFADPKQRSTVQRESEFFRGDVGPCKAAEFVHEATGWGFDATCERGKLHFTMDLRDAKITETRTQRLEGQTCPLK